MKLIRFRQLHSDRWGIALDDDHLRAKLAGGLVEVIHPGQPWWVRLWRRFVPLRPVPAVADGSWHSLTTDH